jgi:hypothetical protein
MCLHPACAAVSAQIYVHRSFPAQCGAAEAPCPPTAQLTGWVGVAQCAEPQDPCNTCSPCPRPYLEVAPVQCRLEVHAVHVGPLTTPLGHLELAIPGLREGR